MEPRSFEEFWPFYVGEHRNRLCRGLHYFGTSGAILIIATALITMKPLLLVAFPIFGYGFAWIGHFFVEKNKPASFKHPAWSFIGDQKMLFYGLTGRMADEVVRLEKVGFRYVATPSAEGSTVHP